MNSNGFVTWIYLVGSAWSSLLTGGAIVAVFWMISSILKREIPAMVNLVFGIAMLFWATFQVHESDQRQIDNLQVQLRNSTRESATLKEDLSSEEAHFENLAKSQRALSNLPLQNAKVSLNELLAEKNEPETTVPQNSKKDTLSDRTDQNSRAIIGHWKGSYQCSKHEGSIDWTISLGVDGKIEVRESYTAHLKFIGDQSGTVFYSGDWDGHTLQLKTESFGGYRVEAHLRDHGSTLSGLYYNKPGCSSLELGRTAVGINLPKSHEEQG